MDRLKPEKMQNIFRIDKNKVAGRGATHGWQVRIYRGIHHRTRFFSDSKFESSDAALAAALEYREQVYAELGIDTGKYTISAQLAANNTTGIIGVNRSETIEPNATIREFWQTAYPSPTHEVRTKSFGVGRFGEIGALQRAVEARMEGISALIGVPDFRGSLESIKALIDRWAPRKTSPRPLLLKLRRPERRSPEADETAQRHQDRPVRR